MTQSAITTATLGQQLDFLRSLGVEVERVDTTPVVDFNVIDQRAYTIAVNLARVEVTPAGRLSVTLFDAEPHHQAAALDHVAYLQGAALFDGAPVVAHTVSLPLPANEVVAYAQAPWIADQLDRPDGCRDCGGRVRTYKRGQGWYCHKCADRRWNAELPTPAQFAAIWWPEMLSAQAFWDRRLREGDYARLGYTVEYCRERAAYRRSAQSFVEILLSHFGHSAARHQRRAERAAKRAARSAA